MNKEQLKSKDGREFKTEIERELYEKNMNKYYEEYKNGKIMTFDFRFRNEYFYILFADGTESKEYHEDNVSVPFALNLIVGKAIYAHKEKTESKYKRYMTEEELNQIKLYGKFCEGETK